MLDRTDRHLTEELCGFHVEAIEDKVEVVGIDLGPDAVAAPAGGGDAGSTGAEEGIEDGVSHEAEHPD